MSPTGQKVSNMLLGKSGEQLLIAPERMKYLGQSGKDAQLWICLMVKVWCCKGQYCIRNGNVRSMNQGKLDVVKQAMASVNIDILGISELKWMGMGEFNSDDHYIYCRQESFRRNGVALIVNKRVWNAVLGCSLKNDRGAWRTTVPTVPKIWTWLSIFSKI